MKVKEKKSNENIVYELEPLTCDTNYWRKYVLDVYYMSLKKRMISCMYYCRRRASPPSLFPVKVYNYVTNIHVMMRLERNTKVSFQPAATCWHEHLTQIHIHTRCSTLATKSIIAVLSAPGNISFLMWFRFPSWSIQIFQCGADDNNTHYYIFNFYF